jgi:ubiquinone/menaquinone biosynthesis C-methylase UbiE
MLETDKVFAGSIPENYDRYMVPLIFEPYAADIARRSSSLSPRTVLETAAGSGVVTRASAPSLPRGASYIVTDLNQPMVDYAASRQPPDTRIKWRQADALALPFENAAFDLVCCQFGAMFFPDRISGYREATRVLKPGGHFLFNVWDRIEENVFADDVTNALAKIFPTCGDRDESRTKPSIFAAPSGRCLLSGNSSSQRNRGLGARANWMPQTRLRTDMAAARLLQKLKHTYCGCGLGVGIFLLAQEADLSDRRRLVL